MRKPLVDCSAWAALDSDTTVTSLMTRSICLASLPTSLSVSIFSTVFLTLCLYESTKLNSRTGFRICVSLTFEYKMQKLGFIKYPGTGKAIKNLIVRK